MTESFAANTVSRFRCPKTGGRRIKVVPREYSYVNCLQNYFSEVVQGCGIQEKKSALFACYLCFEAL